MVAIAKPQSGACQLPVARSVDQEKYLRPCGSGLRAGFIQVRMSETEIDRTHWTQNCTLTFMTNLIYCLCAYALFSSYAINGYIFSWTWLSGSSSINAASVYGQINVENASNVPGARSRAGP